MASVKDKLGKLKSRFGKPQSVAVEMVTCESTTVGSSSLESGKVTEVNSSIVPNEEGWTAVELDNLQLSTSGGQMGCYTPTRLSGIHSILFYNIYYN